MSARWPLLQRPSLEVLVKGKVSCSIALSCRGAAACSCVGSSRRTSLHYRNPAGERLRLFLSLRLFQCLELSLAELTRRIYRGSSDSKEMRLGQKKDRTVNVLVGVQSQKTLTCSQKSHLGKVILQLRQISSGIPAAEGRASTPAGPLPEAHL